MNSTCFRWSGLGLTHWCASNSLVFISHSLVIAHKCFQPEQLSSHQSGSRSLKAEPLEVCGDARPTCRVPTERRHTNTNLVHGYSWPPLQEVWGIFVTLMTLGNVLMWWRCNLNQIHQKVPTLFTEMFLCYCLPQKAKTSALFVFAHVCVCVFTREFEWLQL